MMLKNETYDLTFLLLVSLLLSVYLFFNMHVISLDGLSQHIPMAKMFAAGSFRDALNYSGQQPLYPFLVSVVFRGVGDVELAARLVSSLFGILLIFPSYLLVKEISDKRVAFLSVLFLAVHPYVRRFSADVLKESTYLFFFATSIWLTVRALRREHVYLFFLVPIFSGLAYLVRPDGLEPLFAIFFYVIFAKKFSVSGRRGKMILLLLLSAGILLLPYLVYLRGVTGEWTLSKTKNITGLLSLNLSRNGTLLISQVLYSIKEIVREIHIHFSAILLALMIVGFVKKVSTRFSAGDGLLLSLWVTHCAVLFLMWLNLTDWSADRATWRPPFSGRHVLPLLIISLYWIGEGFGTIHHWLFGRAASFSWFRHMEPAKRSAVILVILVALPLAFMLPKTLKPQRVDKLPEKWAGIWIKGQSGPGTPIFSTLPRVPYYADGIWEIVDPAKDRLDGIVAEMAKKNAAFFVIDGEEVDRFTELADPAQKNFTEVMRYEKKGMDTVIIYRRVS
jgi:hypothetical protein